MGVRYNSSVVTDGLVGYWDAGNSRSYPGSGTTWFDLSGIGNHATLVNSPTYSSNGNFVLNGTSQYFTTNIDALSAGTLLCWFNPTSSPNSGSTAFDGLIDADNPGYYGTGMGLNNGNFETILDNQFWSPNISVDIRSWQMATMTFNSTTARFYKNFTARNSLSYTQGAVAPLAKYYIGKSYANPRYLNGRISIAMIYNRVLSEVEVLQNFNSMKRRFSNDSQPTTYYLPRAFSPDNLQIYYDPFNSGSYPGSGTTLFDLSGNGYNATLVNSPTISASDGITYNPASSQDVYVNQAFDHAYTKTITVNAWFKTTSTSRKIMGTELNATGTGSGGYDNLLYIDSNGKVRWGVYNGVVNTVVSTNSYNDGNWHLATGYQNNATGRSGLYVDGVYIGDMAAITTQPSNYYWRFGGYKMNSWTNTSDNWFSGSIGQVAIYTAVQSAGQILANYNTTKSRYGL